MLDIPRDWLRQKGTPEEFEQARLQKTATAFNIPLEKVLQRFNGEPFGEITEAWRTFVRQLGPNDELWLFSSPDDMFPKKLGCQGYVIVRDGIIRDTLITLMT